MARATCILRLATATLPPPDLVSARPNPEGLGECVVKLSTATRTAQLADYFCPSDASTLNDYDGDLGSGSPTGLPASFGTTADPDLLVLGGPRGVLAQPRYPGGVDQGPGGTDDVVSETGPKGGAWSHPAVWPSDSGYVYIMTGSPGADAGGSSGGAGYLRAGCNKWRGFAQLGRRRGRTCLLEQGLPS